MKSYKGDYTGEISMPIGGIGSGSIGLSGSGSLIDWEIRHAPNRESINSFTNFAVKAENETEVVDFRVLQGDVRSGFMGGKHLGNHSWGYGHGPNRGTMAGFRHFDDVEFKGMFPIGQVIYRDSTFPALITLTAFNPFIPSNEDDSSLPTAFFDFEIENTSDSYLNYTIAFSLSNPLETAGKNRFEHKNGISFMTLESGKPKPFGDAPGNITMATDNGDYGYQEYWFRGEWFDNLTMFINDFGSFGKIKNRTFSQCKPGWRDVAVLTASIKLGKGEKGKIRFNLSWYIPWYRHYKLKGMTPKFSKMKVFYASLFSSSKDVCRYCFDNRERLRGDTLKFSNALHSSTLPKQVLDAIQGTLAVLKSSTCLRFADGSFWAWEGVNQKTGSCFGTCEHVWNYAYAMPFLFPKLEKGVRTYEFKYNLEKSGLLHFRTSLPIGSKPMSFRACVDGQMGTVMKCYREYKISGDYQWLRDNWEKIKMCIEYAWSPQNEDMWDRNKTGIITGRQHHTLDVELFGANSWLTGFYHGALLAGAEMARVMGEEEKAREYTEIYEKGHKWLEENIFDGNKYIQLIDINDREILRPYRKLFTNSKYWDDENGQLKYQIGTGCIIDQVLASWHGDLIGLPPIFDKDHRKKALETIYRLNFKSMRDISNPCRVFACNAEKGVVMCTWENEREKPKIPIPYTEEVMTGFEYAAADNMLQCSMESEALEIISAVRDRYDGKKRNPWAEIECGASYARSMASYSLLLTYSGFIYDLSQGKIGFRPIHMGCYFWSVDGAWGEVKCYKHKTEFRVLYGNLSVKKFASYLPNVKSVTLNSESIPFELSQGEVILSADMSCDDTLTLYI